MADAAPNALSRPSLLTRLAGWIRKPTHRRVAGPTLDEVLCGAEQLLIYATQAGIELDPEVSLRIIAAKRDATAWEGPDVHRLISAISLLAAKVWPVTAQTLASCRNIARAEIRKYTLVAILLVSVILPLSILSFITSGLSNTVSAEIETANDLAVTLHTQLDTPTHPSSKDDLAAPATSMTDLQQFSSTIRSIRDHTLQLNRFLFEASPHKYGDWRTYELPTDLQNTVPALQKETSNKTRLYQDVRRIAKDAQGSVSLYYGAVSTYVLPMLYALLGACAYLLRLFQKELNTGSFSNQYDISARFFTALIGGFIVGLFTNFTLTGASLSPLALAFLVGYAADVFFSFLDGLLSGLKKPAG